MCKNIRRSLSLVLVGLAAALTGQAYAQPDSASSAGSAEPPELGPADTPFDEEITVRGGRTLRDLRLEVEAARQDIIKVYNEVNSNDRNDITCRQERLTGSRMPKTICRSKAQDEADALAGREFLRALLMSAGRFHDPSGEVPIGPQVNALLGTSGARINGVALEEMSRAEIDKELKQLQRENRRLYRAVRRYLDARDTYEQALEEVAAR